MSVISTAPLDMEKVKIDPAWALRVPASLALRRGVLPFAAIDGSVYVATANPNDSTALAAVERFTGLRVVVTLAEKESLQRVLSRIYGDSTRQTGRISTGGTGVIEVDREDAVSLSNDLLHAAFIRQASDIHIEPGREYLRVRFRVDGILEEYQRLPLTAEAGLISRFKVLAGMDIAEKRAPQDGAFTHRAGNGNAVQLVDVRAATLPTKYGEKLTLRLLGLQTNTQALDNLGMSNADLFKVECVLNQPHGLMLLTGPTGSGKTTTLYAAIRKLMSGSELNIITIEDPIEYDIAGVSQVEVNSSEKVSFNKALRSVLRHDPDVLMIGEIRDMDTLDVAVKSSLTGHLVLSTLHTNNAASSITRLTDMGLQRYLIAATLRLCVAQRLVRKLCPHCRKPRELTLAEAKSVGCVDSAGKTVYEPGKCIYCAGRGFVGRAAIFETLLLDGAMSGEVAAGASEARIMELMKQQGSNLLLDDAAQKIFAGTTTVKEVLQTVVGS